MNFGMKLGEIIDALKCMNPEHYVWIEPGPCALHPDDIESYRGYYEDLAINVDAGGYGENAKVAGLLKTLSDAVGKTFVGYKGGNYTMHRNSCVWLATHGDSRGSSIKAIRSEEYRVVIDYERDD